MRLGEAVELYELASVLAPAFVIVSTIASVGSDPNFEYRRYFLLLTIVAVLYYSLIGPLFSVSWGVQLPVVVHAYIYNLFLPLVFGVFASFARQERYIPKILKKMGLNARVSEPSSWDYLFSNLKVSRFVIITCKDKSRYYGLFGVHSMAGSIASCRDILLEQTFVLEGKNKAWKPVIPPKAVYIASSEIRFIEVLNYDPKT